MTQPPNVIIGDASPGSLSTPSAEKGKIRDAKGRMLVVRPLDSLETYRLLRITKASGNEGFFGMAAMAASVQSIDGEPESFINNERDIELMVQRLGIHGMAAVGMALAEFREEEIGEAPKS